MAERLDRALPALPGDLLRLAGRLAEAAICPPGMVLAAMLPPPEYAGRGRRLKTARITPEGSARLRLPDPEPDRRAVPLGTARNRKGGGPGAAASAG